PTHGSRTASPKPISGCSRLTSPRSPCTTPCRRTPLVYRRMPPQRADQGVMTHDPPTHAAHAILAQVGGTYQRRSLALATPRVGPNGVGGGAAADDFAAFLRPGRFQPVERRG